jgi:hypothetical protein
MTHTPEDIAKSLFSNQIIRARGHKFDNLKHLHIHSTVYLTKILFRFIGVLYHALTLGHVAIKICNKKIPWQGITNSVGMARLTLLHRLQAKSVRRTTA